LTRTETIAQSAWGNNPSLTERVGQLFVAYREEIYRFLTGQGLPTSVAQDVTQDVFLKLLLTLRDGHIVRSEQAWLYRVAANRAIDYWRGERRWLAVELDAENTLSETLESAELRPDERAADNQRMGRLAAEIARLPKEQRMCVLLRSQGLRYREMARILGVGVSTTADWLMTALERLRSVIDE
jgi:RNA polymerase sigma-70 factor (ECF subfamily)